MKMATHKLEQEFPQIQKNMPLDTYSTFKVGGPADYFLRIKNTEDLARAYKLSSELKINTFVLGGGSNILFSDKGFRGLIIKNEANKIEVSDTQITAESGALMSQLIQKSIEHNLKGIENFAGLPGTVGAAVRGNAGCHGIEIKDVLVKATVLDEETGEIKNVLPGYFEFNYRESKLKKSPELVLSVTLQLERNSEGQELLREKMKDLLINWRKKQPAGMSAGSFFKNPDGDSAGRLIDECGLKGEKEGDAQVSNEHANFFMNIKNAKQSDIINLARRVAEIVYSKTKTKLEQEVHILDEYGNTVQVS